MDKKEFEKLILEYDLISKAFNNIRLVDPVNKKIIDYHEDTTNTTNIACFDFWGKNKVCDNCVSIRAYHDNRTYIKMEYSDTDLFVVKAIPINLADRRIVLEILENVTDSLFLDSSVGNVYSEIHELIDKMNNLALIDSLTGIYNRRYINEKLPVDIANAAISGSDLSIIMADIDFFKKVNDNFGHLNGDRTLNQFAKILSSSLKRESDWVARFGGEEFMICLPNADLDRAIKIAEDMRKCVEDTEIDCGNYKFKITASFGVSARTQNMGFSMDDLIDQADKKLYEAKMNGRNRVES